MTTQVSETNSAPLEVNKEQNQFSNQDTVEQVYFEANQSNKTNKAIEIAEAKHSFSTLSKEELLEKLKELAESADIEGVYNQINVIKGLFFDILKKETEVAKKAFLEQGGSEEEFVVSVQPIAEEFKSILNSYKEKRSKAKKEKEQAMQDNYLAKQDIIDELKKLIEEETNINEAFNKFNALQEKWRSIGNVPPAQAENLWKTYKHYVDNFYDYVKIHKELFELELKKNLEQKQAICEKAEQLANEISIKKAIETLQNLRTEWRGIGPVPKDFQEQIWERFKAAADVVYQKRKDFLEAIKAKQLANLEQKTNIINELDNLLAATPTSIKEWKLATEKIMTLRQQWKTIGRTPKSVNEKIWADFKSKIKKLLEAKDAYFKQLNKELKENLQRKISLCEQAEILAQAPTEWKNTTQTIINLQKEWKTIGSVPRKHADSIWKRFRAACDDFFNKKASFFEHRISEEENNLQLKKALIEKIKNYTFSDNQQESIEFLKNCQKEWAQIGFVPFKEKEAINAEFKKTIDNAFDKLRISNQEKAFLKFQNKLEAIKKSENAEKELKNERQFILNKIKHIKNEIATLENNILFFGRSKGAEAMKKEFEHKIEKEKQDLKLFEEKLKMLNA